MMEQIKVLVRIFVITSEWVTSKERQATQQPGIVENHIVSG